MDNALILFATAIVGVLLVYFVASRKSKENAYAGQLPDLVQEINRVRIAMKLNPLSECQNLTDAAKNFVLDQYQRQFFSHINPENLNPTQRLMAIGYDGRVGELLAYDLPSASSVVSAWLDDSSNKKLLLDPSSEHIGCGTVIGSVQAWKEQNYDNWNRVPFWCALICSGGSCSPPSTNSSTNQFLGTPICLGNQCVLTGKFETSIPQAYFESV